MEISVADIAKQQLIYKSQENEFYIEQDATNTHKITALFIRSASVGDISTMKECLIHSRDAVDVNARDNAGSTALIYAACLGFTDIGFVFDNVVKLLFENGASVTPKELRYVSLLAMTNSHFEIAQLLNFYTIPQETPLIDSTLEEEDENTLMEIEGEPFVDIFELENNELLMESVEQPSTSSSDDEESNHIIDHIEKYKIEKDDPQKIESQISHVLAVAIQRILPSRREFLPLGANVIYEHAKYLNQNSEHYLESYFSKAAQMVSEWVQLSNSAYTKCYWISNTLQLLVYLKSDQDLVVKTVGAQLEFTDLINDISAQLERLTLSIITPMISSAIAEHEKNEALENIEYPNDLFAFTTAKKVGALFGFQETDVYKPSSVIEELDELLKACKRSGLHKSIIIHLFKRICRSVNITVFQMILGDHYLCSKARAKQMQFNLSEIVGWVRETEMRLFKTNNVMNEFLPCIQLLQFLQIATLFQDSEVFEQLLLSIPKVSVDHIKSVMKNYRFEKGEARFAQNAIDYVVNLVRKIGQDDVSEETIQLPLRPDGSPLWERMPTIPSAVLDFLIRI